MAIDVELKALPGVTVVEGRVEVPGFGAAVAPYVGPLFDRVADALSAAGIPIREPGYAIYEAPGEGRGSFVVRAGFPAEPGDPVADGVEVVELAPVPLAATALHQGSMAGIGEAWMTLMAWIDSEGYRSSAPGREVYLRAGELPQEGWLTELQQPVERIS